MSDPLTPTAGARFVLERLTCDASSARYRGRVLTPDAAYEYELALVADSEPTVTAITAAPDELAATLTMLARLTARSAVKRAADGLPPWPERVTRWRGPGRGAAG